MSIFERLFAKREPEQLTPEQTIAELAIQKGPSSDEWKDALKSLKTMEDRRTAISVFVRYLKTCKSAIYEVCDALAELDTVEAVSPLLKIFRKSKRSKLMYDGIVYDRPTRGVKTTLGPSGQGDDKYPAQALLRISGSLPLLRQSCSAKELERIFALGNRGIYSDPLIIQGIGELGTSMAAGILLRILMEGNDDDEARQSPARQALDLLGKKNPFLLKKMLKKTCTGMWQDKARRRLDIEDNLQPRVPATQQGMGSEDKVSPEDARELIACQDSASHIWPLTNDYNNPIAASWNVAGHSSNWPRCPNCGMDLLHFIDCSDKSGALRDRTPSLRSVMRVRHEWVVQTLIAGTQQHPLGGWGKPAEHWLTLDDPQLVFTIPGGYRGMVWPLLRMVGWSLWWEGGTDRMRQMCGDGHGFSLDLLWHQVGLGNDVWRG